MSIPQTPAMKWRWNPLEVDARLKSSIKQLGSKSLRAIFPGITELIETSTFSNSIELFASYKLTSQRIKAVGLLNRTNNADFQRLLEFGVILFFPEIKSYFMNAEIHKHFSIKNEMPKNLDFSLDQDRYILYKDKIILSPYQLITVITEAALAYDPQSALSSEADISNSGRKIRRKTSLNGALGSSLFEFHFFSRRILEMISLRLDKENFQKTLNEPSPKKKESTSYIISDDSFDEEDEILPKPDVLAEKTGKRNGQDYDSLESSDEIPQSPECLDTDSEQPTYENSTPALDQEDAPNLDYSDHSTTDAAENDKTKNFQKNKRLKAIYKGQTKATVTLSSYLTTDGSSKNSASSLLVKQASSSILLSINASSLLVKRASSSVLLSIDTSSLLVKRASSSVLLSIDTSSLLVKRASSSVLLSINASSLLVKRASSSVLLSINASSLLVKRASSSVLLSIDTSSLLVKRASSSVLLSINASSLLVKRASSSVLLSIDTSSLLVKRASSSVLLIINASSLLVKRASSSVLLSIDASTCSSEHHSFF
ncbi:uncharacterized protein SAPINGB_P000547 [Magnusiomyces paraingens]|uniref:Uncharacterized protein n=1 Tax=Magnusiomyces paraingens TaxID=2606893 RepID=A0A5E8B0N2_9ASCO|nr:uncharacterized protein SAPINGB_P000547 [Saprochaete ingens]VVT44827.1 unnamed protein product [Saprochaete ingens]